MIEAKVGEPGESPQLLTLNAPGTTLRLLRQQAQLSQREVARLAKVSPAYLSLVEAGHREPSRQWLGHVAHVIAQQMNLGAA